MYTRQSLHITGFQGAQVPNRFFKQPGDTPHLGIVLPGLGYTCRMPLLYYTTQLLLAHNFDILQVEYAYGQRKEFSAKGTDEKSRIIRADVVAAYDMAFQQRAYERVLLVGKSLGTLAVGQLLTADLGVKDIQCIWLTPLLANQDLRQQIERTKPGSLFIAGTADRHHQAEWFTKMVAITSGTCSLIDGANHSLEFVGDIDGSLDALRKMLDEIRRFVRVNFTFAD